MVSSSAGHSSNHEQAEEQRGASVRKPGSGHGACSEEENEPTTAHELGNRAEPPCKVGPHASRAQHLSRQGGPHAISIKPFRPPLLARRPG